MNRTAKRQKTVLVVQNISSTRRSISELLATEGYDVLQAGDSQDGLRLARQHHPDAILLDMALPPYSGLDVLARLRGGNATRHIPVVVIGGQHPSATWHRGTEADRTIQKSFDAGALLVHLERITEVAQTDASGGARGSRPETKSRPLQAGL